MPSIPKIDSRKKESENIELHKQLNFSNQQKKTIESSKEYIKTFSDYLPGARNINTVNPESEISLKRGMIKVRPVEIYSQSIDKISRSREPHQYIHTEGDLQEMSSNIFSKRNLSRGNDRRSFNKRESTNQIMPYQPSRGVISLPDYEDILNTTPHLKETSCLREFSFENKIKDPEVSQSSGQFKNLQNVWERSISNRNQNLLDENLTINTDLQKSQLKRHHFRSNTPTIIIHSAPKIQHIIDPNLEKYAQRKTPSTQKMTEYINLKSLVGSNSHSKISSSLKPKIFFKEGQNMEVFDPQVRHQRHKSESKQRLNIEEVLPFIESRNQTRQKLKFKFKNQEAVVDKLFGVHRRVQTEHY